MSMSELTDHEFKISKCFCNNDMFKILTTENKTLFQCTKCGFKTEGFFQ